MACAPGTLGAASSAMHRRRALGVEQQEIAPALPRPLLDQLRLDAEFGDAKRTKRECGTERMMMEGDHRAGSRRAFG